MNRAFVSLYLIVVLSIVLLGLALNRIWDEINPSPEIDTATIQLIKLVEGELDGQSIADQKISLERINKKITYELKLIGLENFSNTNITVEIKQGKIITFSSEHELVVYKLLNNSNNVLQLTIPVADEHKPIAYIFFIALFYGLIALSIFFWVWPLARDLNKLAQYSKEIGTESEPKKIQISHRSVVYSFAKTFNRMAERLSNMIRSQKEMTSAVSHELRTPLARMKFSLAMIDSAQLMDAHKLQLANISKDVADMETLINSLLAYAGFELQTRQLVQREGYVQDLLFGIIERTSNPNNIVITISDTTDAKSIHCEWSLMQTALQNIIGNAIDFASATIKIQICDTPTNYQIDIEDDGVGVSEEYRNRIFESFFRIYDEASNRSGFGLGLPLVKRIMEWHQGSVCCLKSNLGGALFRLEWPKPLEIAG